MIIKIRHADETSDEIVLLILRGLSSPHRTIESHLYTHSSLLAPFWGFTENIEIVFNYSAFEILQTSNIWMSQNSNFLKHLNQNLLDYPKNFQISDLVTLACIMTAYWRYNKHSLNENTKLRWLWCYIDVNCAVLAL